MAFRRATVMSESGNGIRLRIDVEIDTEIVDSITDTMFSELRDISQNNADALVEILQKEVS